MHEAIDPDLRSQQVLGQPPRIAPMPEGRIGPRGAELVDQLRKLHTDIDASEAHETFRTLFKHHDAAQAYLELGVLFTLAPALAPRDKELVILRTAWLCGSPVAWGEHVQSGKLAGLTSAEIRQLIEGSAAPGWSADDHALVAAAEELHCDAMIGDATWAALAMRLDERQMIELPMLVGHYHMTAFIQNSLRFKPREGNLGLGAR